MKMRALATAFSLLVAGSAQAAPMLVAGWDFSQYSPGFLSTDFGNSLTDVLPSNYSDLDDVGELGLGNGSGYGTMHLDGLFGSFDTPLNGSDPFRPLAPGLTLNTNMAAVAGVLMGSGPAGIALQNDGQADFQDVRMVARGTGAPSPLDVVFEVDLGTSFLGSAWQLDFAGQTSPAQTLGSSVAVAFSTDGSTYNPIGTAALTTAEQVFSFALGGLDLDQIFVRLSFTGSNSILPSIDNFTLKAEVTPVSAPEPGTALLTVSGLLGLGVFGRRRSR
jgi:hypothetical protein